MKFNQTEKDSLIKILNEQSKTLKTSNDILNTTLNTNTNIFNGLSTYFTIISILLSIIIVAIPIVNYFLVLRPNQESLEKLKKLEVEIPEKIENNFDRYMSGFEKRKVKQQLSDLRNEYSMTQLSNHLTLYGSLVIDTEDLNNITSFLSLNQDENLPTRSSLNDILKSQNSLISEYFYKGVLEKEVKLDYKDALEFLIENNFENNLKFIELIIAGRLDGHEILLDIYHYLRDKYVFVRDPQKNGLKKFLLLFNNEKICESVRRKTLPNSRKDDIDEWMIEEFYPRLQETLYFKQNFDDNGIRKT